MEHHEMLELLQKREQSGLNELLRRYSPLIRYIIRGILTDEREQEECYNDVALLVWDRFCSYDSQKGKLVPWLTALTRNAALNRLRRLRHHEELTEAVADGGPGPEEQILRKEVWDKLQTLICAMSRSEKELFYRKYYYLQSIDRIAAEMGLTERAVEGRLYRLRQRLQRGLGGDLDGR